MNTSTVAPAPYTPRNPRPRRLARRAWAASPSDVAPADGLTNPFVGASTDMGRFPDNPALTPFDICIRLLTLLRQDFDGLATRRSPGMLLEGLRVVEMATWVAGPGCAMIMAEWGADVIKVESPAGDATRLFFPDTEESPGNPVFSMENRGKRGVVLDTARAEGRAALIEILKGADVFVTNVRPGALARARLDYASLKDTLPSLVYACVTGYGLQGAEADTPPFDLTGFWTRSGVAASTIPPDQEPFTCRPGFGDHFTAVATLSGVLAALRER